MLGLPKDTVILRPFAAEWRELFILEQERLRCCIGDYALDIQHVGSTSIPGMPAKPILDIAIAVEDFEEAVRCVRPMESLGYTFRGENGIARRHYFTKGDPRTHHVHMVEIASEDWEITICFRDYLLQHPEVAQAYAELKTGLVKQFPADRVSYQDGKADFIQRVLCEARGLRQPEYSRFEEIKVAKK